MIKGKFIFCQVEESISQKSDSSDSRDYLILDDDEDDDLEISVVDYESKSDGILNRKSLKGNYLYSKFGFNRFVGNPFLGLFFSKQAKL